MSYSQSYHIKEAESLLKQWEDHTATDAGMHSYSTELLMAAQVHATLAISMKVLDEETNRSSVICPSGNGWEYHDLNYCRCIQ